MQAVRFFFVTLCLLLAVYPQLGYAQELERERDSGFHDAAPKDEFIDPSYKNLSKLYWRLGMLDVGDSKNIDNFLLINECDLYKKYIHNEFEWGKLRRATAASITKNLQGYPNTFEAMVPIFLGAYDVDKERFEVTPESRVATLKRIRLLYNKKRDLICKRFKKDQEIANYPKNITIVLNKPLSVKYVPVKRELAELYISESNDYYNGLPTAYKNRETKYQRLAYLRLKFEVLHSLGKEPLSARGGVVALVIGRAVGYEIFADSKKQKPLYAEDFKLKRIKKRGDASADTLLNEKVEADGQQPPSSGEATEASSVDNQTVVVAPDEAAPVPTPTPEPTSATSADTPAADHQ